MQKTKRKGKFILYGPNVHNGGGLVLLQDLLKVNRISIQNAFLSLRAKDQLILPKGTQINYIKGLFSRIKGEWSLKKLCTAKDITLCFHGVPPLFSIPGKVVVFAQNRLIFEKGSLCQYDFKTRLRLHLERFWIKLTHKSSIQYIVQTPSMASSLKQQLGADCHLRIVPFMETKAEKIPSKSTRYDFIYIASGEPHKNHHTLIKAWEILGKQGLKPSLAITIDPHVFPNLIKILEKAKLSFHLNMTNLGVVPHEEVKSLYASSGALIFPSSLESLGLPLIEASQYGLPIIASEKDFVRDSVNPTETFDPSSPVSIARAVRRFMKKPEPSQKIQSAFDFLKEVNK